ncbi:mCG1033970, partial [Mus musculus]
RGTGTHEETKEDTSRFSACVTLQTPVTSQLRGQRMTPPVNRLHSLLTSVDSYEPRKITRNLL